MTLPSLPRRAFLKDAVLGGAALWAARPGLASLRFAPGASAAPGTRIEILPGEPIGLVSPDFHGHFTEHIGGVVYDGIWVGEDSPIPNIGGIRKALVEHMRRIRPSVVRWPGGCFADSYNWRDGIGPRAQRPRRTNFWIVADNLRNVADGPQNYEPNSFGTNEFVRFCKLIGAQPYLAANLRSASARDFYEWVEYCNAPAGLTTLSDLRAAAGRGAARESEPFEPGEVLVEGPADPADHDRPVLGRSRRERGQQEGRGEDQCRP